MYKHSGEFLEQDEGERLEKNSWGFKVLEELLTSNVKVVSRKLSRKLMEIHRFSRKASRRKYENHFSRNIWGNSSFSYLKIHQRQTFPSSKSLKVFIKIPQTFSKKNLQKAKLIQSESETFAITLGGRKNFRQSHKFQLGCRHYRTNRFFVPIKKRKL